MGREGHLACMRRREMHREFGGGGENLREKNTLKTRDLREGKFFKAP